MGIFSWLFGRKPATEKETPALKRSAASAGISYDAGLVETLKNDHQQLLVMYTGIRQAAEAAQYDKIGPGLKAFKHALQSHLVVENVRFYVYVQQHLAADSEASSLVADLRRDMDGIAHAVVKFIHRYESVPFTPEMAGVFLNEFGEIGKVLVQRIQTEEAKLYTLYLPRY